MSHKIIWKHWTRIKFPGIVCSVFGLYLLYKGIGIYYWPPRIENWTIMIGALTLLVSAIIIFWPSEVSQIVKEIDQPYASYERVMDGQFPSPRYSIFFKILDNAIKIQQIDLFAHYHAHWLGITDKKKEDITGFHGVFYPKLFKRIKKRKFDTPPKIRIFFLKYGDCPEDIRRKVADILGVWKETDSLKPDVDKIKYWEAEATEKFTRLYNEDIKREIESNTLHPDSEIRYADFFPTMGIIRIKYEDEFGLNT